MADNVRRQWASLILMVASGFAGLGYQIVWTQQSALWLGHESAAVLAVVAAFFGGLALGALTFGARIENTMRPARWYASCELVIALWSLVLIFAMSPLSAWMARVTGSQPTPLWHWFVAFSGTFVLLLPATAAMGATLPAMERITARVHSEGRSVAALYAGNTFGAVFGVMVTAFWLVPTVGLNRSILVCVTLNSLCAVLALCAFPPTIKATPTTPSNPNPPGFLRRLAFTGLLGIGYEVLAVRVLSQVTENTVYTFALLLAVYLTGTAVGAACLVRSRKIVDEHAHARLADVLLGTLAAACLFGTMTLWTAERCLAFCKDVLGSSAAAAMLAEAGPALIALGPPTIVMGALFSHLSRQANAAGISFGRAIGFNTLGAAAAPAVFGVLALPALGPKFSLLLICVGYLLLAGWRSWLRPIIWAPASAVLAVAFFAPALAFIDVPQGGRVVSYEDGIMAAVSVVQDAQGVSRLRINHRQHEGTSATLRVDGRQAWLPLLLHPAPRRVLFLGLGTGVTASSAAEDSSLNVDAVELLPEVVAASAHFRPAFADSAANRLHVIAADARRFVRASERQYDVIVSDNFHPARSGSGSLYTVEHFGAVRARLQPGGVFCQWLPLHQMDLQTLRSIVKSFTTAYPRGTALIASNSLETPVLGLIGHRDTAFVNPVTVRRRLAQGGLPARVAALGFEDEFAVLGSFVAGPKALQRFAANSDANTDDHPVVAYRAPRITYASDSTPRDRLLTLLRELSIEPDELLHPPYDSVWSRRLAAYWTARNRFIESGRNVVPSSNVQAMLAQVREPLLSVLRISPDFRPAYDPLFAMANALSRIDVTSARTLFTELTQIQPTRPEALRALALLNANTSNRQ